MAFRKIGSTTVNGGEVFYFANGKFAFSNTDYGITGTTADAQALGFVQMHDGIWVNPQEMRYMIANTIVFTDDFSLGGRTAADIAAINAAVGV